MSGRYHARAIPISDISQLFQQLSVYPKEYASMMFTTKCELCRAKATVVLGIRHLCGEHALEVIKATKGSVPKLKGIR